MDIPKMLPPEAYTGEMKDGVKQDAKNFMTDVNCTSRMRLRTIRMLRRSVSPATIQGHVRR